ncbi:MAG: signal peptide peptidase SppA [Bdellovibrionales bacterium]
MHLQWQKIRRVIIGMFAAIGCIAVLFLVVGAIALARLETARPAKPASIILTLDLDREIVEQPSSSPFRFAIHEESVPLLDILQAIDLARTDPNVKGLIARFGSSQPGFAHAEEIHAAILRFRESGKPTYAFGTSYGEFGNGNRAYFMASAFEHIWLQPVGSVSLTGIAIEAPFARGTLDKLGVTPDFMQREEYKSFVETFTRESFSEPARANMQSMIDNIADLTAEGIAAGRKWEPARVRQLMARGPFTADEALKHGLVTQVGYIDALEGEVIHNAGGDTVKVDADDYLSFGGRSGSPKAHVALILGTGMITDHEDGPAGMADSEVMGADKIASAFRDAAADDAIKAIIFRIDSPGGSPSASETIRAALMRAQKAGKPVFVSMANVAASGGYWVAMNADNITAQPGTLTGSIGVVAGKFVAAGLMEKIGVSWDTLSTGGNAGMWSLTKGFTPAQRERMTVFIDDTYRSFVEGVSKAREIPMEKMPSVAKGRVFTGAQAVKLGLVDQLGGYAVTLAELRKKLELAPDDVVEVQIFPAPLTPAEKVLRILKGIGLEGAMLRSSLAELRGVMAALRPLWRDVHMYGTPGVKAF